MINLKEHWDFTSQASVLVSIEFLVNNITRRQVDLMSVSQRHRGESSQERFYRHKILEGLEDILNVYQPGYIYSELIEAFWFACRRVGLLDAYGVTERATGFSYEMERERSGAVDALIRMLPGVVMSEACQRRGNDRRYESDERSRGIESYVQAVLDTRARSMVVRLDFGYRKDAQPYVTVDVLYESIDRFREMKRRGHPLFESLTGYVLNLEQGIERGFHGHLGLIYDGSEVLSDWYRGEMAKEVWATCTDGMGTVYVCNANKAEYERRKRCGIGMVRRDDWVKRRHVVAAMQYLSDPDKEDQYLRIRSEDRRAFWKGRPPGKEERRGRPPRR